MTAAERIIAAARKELGTKEDPAGSNRVKYNTWYYGREVSGGNYPWCMVFIQWLFAQIGVSGLLPIRTASCGELMRAAKAAGLWITGGYRPGDVVIYDFPGGAATDHCGLVESVSGSSITAIEGNTGAGNDANGGQVQRRTRSTGQIVGAVRPKYEEDEKLKIAELTDAEILQLAVRLQEVLGKQPLSPALAAELAEAKAKGITDGTRPGAFCTRAQAAIMALREGKAK